MGHGDRSQRYNGGELAHKRDDKLWGMGEGQASKLQRLVSRSSDVSRQVSSLPAILANGEEEACRPRVQRSCWSTCRDCFHQLRLSLHAPESSSTRDPRPLLPQGPVKGEP